MQQDEAFFTLVEDGQERPIRFHDYGKIYERPGLYEQLFYDRLKCQSPQKVAEVLRASVAKEGGSLSGLRALDLGAGNGMAGEALAEYGVARLVGMDIIAAARDASERDRPWLYDQYYVSDLTALDDAERSDLLGWNFNCLVTVAALGFADIPPEAFRQALNLLEPNAWVAFNIKETFLDHEETSGFSRMIRRLILSQHFGLVHLERYRHRYSIDGEPLFYFAIVARKVSDTIPEDVLPD
jgi:predicted TPR repeat methyltransferase